jgi:hypothetical protein
VGFRLLVTRISRGVEDVVLLVALDQQPESRVSRPAGDAGKGAVLVAAVFIVDALVGDEQRGR